MTVLIQFLINTCIKIDLFPLERVFFAGCRAGPHFGNLPLKYDRSDTIFNPNLQTSHLQSDFASKLIFFPLESVLPDAEQVRMPRHGQLSSVQEV